MRYFDTPESGNFVFDDKLIKSEDKSGSFVFTVSGIFCHVLLICILL
jgi:hypothetical protein